MILASDGIWGCMSNREVIKFLGQRFNSLGPNQLCESLIHESRSRWNTI